MNDPRYAELFDVALKSCEHTDPSVRKRCARTTAIRAMQVLQAGATNSALATLRQELAEQIGDRSAQSVMKATRALRPAKVRHAEWRPGKKPRFAIMTADKTANTSDQMYEALRSIGADVWYYRQSIRVGRRIRNEDERALIEADYVVYLVSRAALDSNYVAYETDIVHWLEMADRRERLLPVIVDDLSFNELPPVLAPLQALSLPKQGLDGVIGEIKARIAEDRA